LKQWLNQKNLHRNAAKKMMLPEEQELIRLATEQSELEDRVSSTELSLETMKNETILFQQRYYQTVGRLYAKLDELVAQIANLLERQKPEDSALKEHAHAARQRARSSSEEAGLIEESAKPAAVMKPELKEAYRRAVKLMHPDLALSDRERQRRNKLMAALNLAYERGDLTEIERLIVEFGHDPEAIVGEDVASRIVKTIRRIAQLRRRLVELELELAAHQKTEAFTLRQTVETAEATGADPLNDLAQQITSEISRREVELKAATANRT
jgi:hypothetical protein